MNTISTHPHQHHTAQLAAAAAAVVAMAFGSVVYTVAQRSGTDIAPGGGSPAQVTHGKPLPYNPSGGKMQFGP